MELDEAKNGALLRNMCNGLRGKNTEVLTYSGPANTRELKAAKKAKRRAAGCVDRFCRNPLNNGGNSKLNSCDEYPPASSDEGGDARPEIRRAINCIPSTQNTLQGTTFRSMMNSAGLKKGDKFVISIDCDKVLNDILVPREEVSDSGSATPLYRTGVVNDTNSYIIIPLGDLSAGSYTVSFQLTAGSASEAFLIDNQGDDLIDPLGSFSSGQSRQVPFTVEDDDVGVGLVFATRNNATNITWTFEGSTTPTTSASESQSTVTALPGSESSNPNGAQRQLMPWWASVIALTVLLVLEWKQL
ncbi:hypothetical protein HGRIS_004972 [Hohenbuehelia grisea]|uniref:Deoxyribonuclease NucA/NucB domain-containing protein n=1 Tax=Hohenbuehelia grisea TaxID=104357 RepID=A0ABR3JEE5_9AGAR